MPFKKINYDNILGLGNKKKKAEKKVKKAEKQLAKGNVKAAERKISKAVKKLSQTANPDASPVKGKILSTQQKIEEQKKSIQAMQEATTPVAAVPVTDPGQILAIEPKTTLPGVEPSAIPSGGTGQGWETTYESKQMQTEDEGEETQTDEGAKPVNIKTLLLIAAAIAVIFFWPKISKLFKK